ncbi:hypothetical protein I6A60_39675 [Frankia sp. AgB1.9]|uniref:hypothetical protein n=1 Tax=unclassified Frankia TaxID=2632575 RepID=UPI001932430B|nr:MULTISPECIES: hypothetical protein [unclassified Frankia]MBL7489553.1 hypothetical protein [Frankia sp. AgW1.1]MBL7553906.1 hypothetical protein [Frankia sp. AgB1.9]MBL7621847.1 hypothetical protein [Frankia sp. AgB1.8]
MALRISVDLDGLRWADLFRFVDLARNGGIGPDDQVDVITYGSDPMSVSLSARIFPQTDGFLAVEPDGGSDALRSSPLSISAAPATNGSAPFGYESAPDRSAPSNGSHYPAFDNAPPERPSSPPPSYPAYDAPADRGAPQQGGNHYPSFDNGQPDRLPGGGGGSPYAGFEPAFDRGAPGKELPGGNPADSPYIEEFARLQEGLMRQVRRNDEVRPERA